MLLPLYEMTFFVSMWVFKTRLHFLADVSHASAALQVVIVYMADILHAYIAACYAAHKPHHQTEILAP